MKSSILYSLAFMALLITACRKNDNPRVPEFDKVPMPVMALGEDETNKIPGADPLAFESSFSVDLNYKNGDAPKQFDVVVIRNGDKSNVKVLQAGVTSFPATVAITGQQLADLFGETPDYGDLYVVGADVTTQDGKKWEAFPADGITYAPGVANEPGVNPTVQFKVPCLFVPAEYTAGEYEVIQDDWEDYPPGEIIMVNKIDDTHYSFQYAADNAVPIIMEVNPVNNAITVQPTLYGDYGGLEVTATSVPGDDSEADPCDISFSVKLNHVYSGGDLGDYVIKLKKKQ